MSATILHSAEASNGTRTTARSKWHVTAACRAIDVVGSLVALILLSPLMALIVVAIRLDSPGTPLFRQRRVGHGLRRFTINKFRTMYSGSDHAVHRTFVHDLIRGDADPQPLAE